VHQHLTFEASAPERSGPLTAVPHGVPKMRDVAQLAGVSPQTVSRVLNAPELVSHQTRARVLQVIDEVGYRRNSAARALSSSKSRTIGVVDSGSTILGQARMLETVQEAARTAGYATSVAIVHRPSAAAIQEAFRHLIEMDVEGIVVMGNTAALVEAAALAASRVPLAMIASSQLTAPQVIQVAPAGSASARAATRHLLDQGCARIAHVAGPDGWVDAQAREEGWRTELESHGLPADAVFRGDWLPGSGYQAGLDIVEQGSIDGVFAANDHMALGALAAFARAGLDVPHDIAVVGYDDLLGAEYFQPPLTTVRQEFALMGERCIAQLLSAIAGQPTQDVEIPAELIVRDSSLRGAPGGGAREEAARRRPLPLPGHQGAAGAS
jgi:DNA-binding LacI/PurR family transcriptional regulator